MIKVLFVCLGNICRSPMAQFVFKQMVEERGLSELFEIDSAATESYNEMCHAGIHHGTREMLKSMHVPFEEHYSRHIRPSDYAYYDYILAMDDSNIEDIQSIVGVDTDNKIGERAVVIAFFIHLLDTFFFPLIQFSCPTIF